MPTSFLLFLFFVEKYYFLARPLIETNIGLKGSFFRRKKFGRMKSELGERRMNPLSPVKYVFRYERSGVRKTCVRRVKFPFPINSTAGSVYMRSTGEFRSFKHEVP